MVSSNFPSSNTSNFLRFLSKTSCGLWHPPGYLSSLPPCIAYVTDHRSETEQADQDYNEDDAYDNTVEDEAIDDQGMPLPAVPPTAARAQPGAGGVAAQMASMSVGGATSASQRPSTFSSISTASVYPFFIKTFVYNGQEWVTVEFYVPGRPGDAFQVSVLPSGDKLSLTVNLPGWLFEENRIVTELQGYGRNEAYMQAHQHTVQAARSRFGNNAPITDPQVVRLPTKCRRDFMEVNRLDYDGKELVERDSTAPTRNFEHMLRVTLKSTREMLARPVQATTDYHGDPDAEWVHVRP